ncbi:MAG: alpha/beta hydrolase [Xenococcaceae cyanobacterium MO_188.B32]|nr:alpha/beta hydrolase [Xenococcaceae cyanobacterium MO_188.B32]
MICREGTFTGVDRLQLYYQSWDPKQKVKGVVVIVHGLGGHSNKYNNVVNHLVARGFTLYAFDQRGHGRSPGQRGYISSWAELRTDLDTFLKLVKTETKDCPCFLLGHSLGGALVLDYGLRIKNPQTELQGIIAMAPPLGAVGVPSWRRLIGSVLSRIYPRFSLDLGIDLSYGSRDPQVVEAYKKDTLRHSRGTARLSTEFSKTVAWINSHPQDWQLPLLILYGGEDKVTLPHNNHLFFNGITFADKEIKEYPESYHELQNDLNYQEVLADIEDWLERHL